MEIKQTPSGPKRVRDRDFANLNNSKRNKRRSFGLGSTALLLGALTLATGYAGPREIKDCQTYQGHIVNKTDGERGYVFNPESSQERIGSQDYTFTAKSNLTNDLEIGESYCFEAKSFLGSLYNGRIVKIKPNSGKNS